MNLSGSLLRKRKEGSSHKSRTVKKRSAIELLLVGVRVRRGYNYSSNMGFHSQDIELKYIHLIPLARMRRGVPSQRQNSHRKFQRRG